MKPLSFIIITYNRPADMLELLQNISQLDRAEQLLEEVIVVNNASTEDYSQVKQYMLDQSRLPFRYFDAPDNLGVSKGRNYALKKGTAPICIMLDDDAVLGNKDCLINLANEFETNNTGRPKAIVSFKVCYYSTGAMQQNAFPHKHFNEYRTKSFFETYYYAGGAHAIRRAAIEQLGYYPEDFFYGMEEYDLSYRLLEAGYAIVYSDQVLMLHKESPLGRKPRKEQLRMMWVNKSKVAWRYLPGMYFISTSCMWSLEYLRLTGYGLMDFFQGWREVWQIPGTEKRKPVSQTTLAYLRKVKARLWY